MSMREQIVVEQRAVIAESATEFKSRLDGAFRDGWHIVPGTIAISLCPEGQHHSSKERYVAVVEK